MLSVSHIFCGGPREGQAHEPHFVGEVPVFTLLCPPGPQGLSYQIPGVHCSWKPPPLDPAQGPLLVFVASPRERCSKNMLGPIVVWRFQKFSVWCKERTCARSCCRRDWRGSRPGHQRHVATTAMMLFPTHALESDLGFDAGSLAVCHLGLSFLVCNQG